jgi:FixJ family two-component response regulator
VTAALRTVVVVDDDPAFRLSMEQFLSAAGYRPRAYASAEAFLASPPPEGPACVLVDLRMPGMSGLQLQEELARAGRSCALVFLSGHGGVKATAQAMKGGAVDFLEKPYEEEALLEAIDRALARDAAARAAGTERAEARARLARLTPAERQVCELLARGKRNKEIAAALGKSESTVKAQHWGALSKLGVSSAVELARLLGLAGPGEAP